MSTDRRHCRSQLPLLLVVAIQGVLAPACLTTQHEPPQQSRECTACHGDPSRASINIDAGIDADRINKAAPPLDLNGESDPMFRGVGAHQNHLTASDSHEAVACAECHVVPDSVFGNGHFETGGHAQITFGPLATTNDASPTYDAENAKCSNTYCHQSLDATNEPKWQAPRDSTKACGSCHGLPPPAPHPQSDDCFKCHGNEIDANRHFIDRSLHVNGKRDTGTLQCNSCHGTDPKTGGPPPDLEGNTTPDQPGVGAHQNHLQASATHDAIACSTCHVVPTEIDLNDAGSHVFGTPPAPITFSGLALANNANPTFNPTTIACSNTYCHQSLVPSNNPNWTAPRDSTAACGSCHGLPPPAPHPQNTNCSQCHSQVIDANRNFTNKSLHIDGKVEIDTACNSCHGTDSSGGPPPDLAGNTTSDHAGVGAHQNHLLASDTHDAVRCDACHLVPADFASHAPLDAGLPATVTFGGLALANNANPTFNPTTLACSNTYCHQSLVPTNNPNWMAPRDSTAACGSCHGLPPPAPHPQNSHCSHCHSQVIDAKGNFINKALHIDGKVQIDTACNSCHGTDSSGGPPPDLAGNTTSEHAGVGAHQNHLLASVTHDAVRCDACHVVPTDFASHAPLDAGLPATVTFGGLALANNANPTFNPTTVTCSDTYCHQSLVRTNNPNWMAPRDSTAACGSCHGLPPPAPHPQNPDCSTCHSQVIDANRNLVDKSLHINGVVDLATACNGCHGTAANGSPPPDLEGNTTSDHVGVGAHQNHLQPSATHGSVPCNSCHAVPTAVDSPGHLDATPTTIITFSGLAVANGANPTFDSANVTCNNTYCHQSLVPANNPNWTAPRDSAAACGSCHGLPPPAPHPQKTDCSICHSQVVDSNRNFVNVALHIDGTVQVNPQCNSCHGTATDGSPPPDLSGNADTTFPGVGAHQRHLQAAATHGAVTCNQCHIVPSVWNTPGHFDGTPPAVVTFGTLATLNSSAASFSSTNFTCTNVYCHMNDAPNWIGQLPESATCGTCHALPPPFVAGVAISNQSHPKISDCSRCHGAIIDQNLNFIAPDLHVDGTVEVTLNCSSCHGSSASSAPPTDLSGNTDVSALGVGAHQTHLNGGPYFRPVLCSECHVVPQNINDPGHIDDWTTAEVTFSGAAISSNRLPNWDRQSATCANLWCHNPDPHGGISPVWNDPNVSLGCDTCHGFPPSAPHQQSTQCNTCHSNYRSSGTFVDPTLHVNGTIDF